MSFRSAFPIALTIVALAAYQARAANSPAAGAAQGDVPAAAAAAGAGIPTAASSNPSTSGPTATQMQGATSMGVSGNLPQGVPYNPSVQLMPTAQVQGATAMQSLPASMTSSGITSGGLIGGGVNGAGINGAAYSVVPVPAGYGAYAGAVIGGRAAVIAQPTQQTNVQAQGMFPNNNAGIFSGGGTAPMRAMARTALTNATNPQEQWRYRTYNNQTWYWTAGNRWMVYTPNGWAYAQNNGNNTYTTGYGGAMVPLPTAPAITTVPAPYTPANTTYANRYYYSPYGYQFGY